MSSGLQRIQKVFNRNNRLEKKAQNLAQEEAELEKRLIKDREEEMARQQRNQILREEAGRKLKGKRIALVEAELEAKARKARREAEKARNDASHQARLVLEAEQHLVAAREHKEQLRRWADEEMRSLDKRAQLELARERQKAEAAERQLQQMLEIEEEKRHRHQENVRLAEAGEHKDIKMLEEAQNKLELALINTEKMRQRDEVRTSNSPEALRELRELIRRRYELDMDIWQSRSKLASTRPLTQRKMVEADGILREILARVEKWDEASGWDDEDWDLAEEVKARLEKGGKRDWLKEPPWKGENSGPPRKPLPRRVPGRRGQSGEGAP
jgi:hypothetical protein